MSRVTATATLEVVSAKMDALTAAIQALVAAQSHAVVTPIAAPQAAPVPTQAPANDVPMAEPYRPTPAVPAKPEKSAKSETTQVAPAKHDAKPVIPSVAAWQHDGVLWVAFPPMGTCIDEAIVLFDALKGESWFVNFDKSGNASAKKSVRVLPYIADKGLAAKYSGHSAAIGSFDRAPKLADVAKRVKTLFVDMRDYFATVKAEDAHAKKAAPVAKPAESAPVFA